MASLAWHERESLVMEGGTIFYFVTAQSTKRWHAQGSRWQKRRQARLEAESQWCGSICRTPIAFPLLLVGRDAIETCHGSDDEYREVGFSRVIGPSPLGRIPLPFGSLIE